MNDKKHFHKVNEMIKEGVKACPVCGSDQIAETGYEEGQGYGKYWTDRISCTNCNFSVEGKEKAWNEFEVGINAYDLVELLADGLNYLFYVSERGWIATLHRPPEESMGHSLQWSYICQDLVDGVENIVCNVNAIKIKNTEYFKENPSESLFVKTRIHNPGTPPKESI